MLADFEISEALAKGYLNIEPWDGDQLQPVSYDLKLDSQIRSSAHDVDVIDPKGLSSSPGMVQPGGHEAYMVPATISEKGYTLFPGQFILACTEEVVTLSPNIAGRVEGKSSLGRLGVQVHITAGFIDPGFSGQITLEIANVAPWGVRLYPGMPIAQIVFTPVSAPERDYTQTGHYCGQRGPTESRYRL